MNLPCAFKKCAGSLHFTPLSNSLSNQYLPTARTVSKLRHRNTYQNLEAVNAIEFNDLF